MDYSNFDIKAACKKYSMIELELMLFRSRCQKYLKFSFELWKRDKLFDPLYLVVIGTVSLFYFLCIFFYSIFDSLRYLLTHKRNEKSVARYSEIKWDPKRIEQRIRDGNDYTSIEDIERIEMIIDDIREKIIEEERNKYNTERKN